MINSRFTDAHTLTLARGGCWHGRYGTASCPVCQPEGRSDQIALTISDGAKGILLHCKKSGCNFRDILVGLGIQPGLPSTPDPAIIARRAADQRARAEKRAQLARMLWDEAKPIKGTVAETYLRGRGITCALPQTLRFNPECWHPEARRCLPAMVARVDGAERFAMHRTYMRPDGSGKAQVEPQRAMLGTTAGGAVRLSEGLDALAVAEGIENALSLLCGPLCGSVAVWAALSTSGMASLRLPPRAGSLIVATDGDTPGKSAGTKLAERASALGWSVTMFPAPDGRDWNDVVQNMKGAAA